MELYRFSAPDSHRAMVKVQETLGLEAYIYSTHRVQDGVEILAGLAEKVDEIVEIIAPREVKQSFSHVDYMLIESMHRKLQLMDQNMMKLSNQLNELTKLIKEKDLTERKKLSLNVDWDWVWMNLKALLDLAKKALRPALLRLTLSRRRARMRRTLKEGIYG